MPATIERPYQFEQLADLGRRSILPHADPRIAEEVATRMSEGPKSPKETATHFMQFHVGQYLRDPSSENRVELLAIMAGYEYIARRAN